MVTAGQITYHYQAEQAETTPLFFRSSPEIAGPSLLQFLDNETPMKKAKISDAGGLALGMVTDACHTILSLEFKLHTSQVFLKELEAHASTIETCMASQQGELDWVKGLLALLEE